MAATLSMHLPHRPSKERSPSFDQPRARSTPPFTSPYDSAPTPSMPTHSRASSSSSTSSLYQQPPFNNYLPSQHPSHSVYAMPQTQAWPTTALPASAFYASPFQAYPQAPIFQPGFQQSQADFAAWSNAYQHMVMASVAGGASSGEMTPPPQHHTDHPEEDRRRTSSGPKAETYGQNYMEQQPLQPAVQSQPSKSKQAPQPFHPYKRDPSQRPSKEDFMPRSSSQPNLSSILDGRPPHSSITLSRPYSEVTKHHRTSSFEASKISPSNIPPVRVASRNETRPGSFSSEQENQPLPRVSSPQPIKSSSTPTIRAVPSPLLPATNAANTPQTMYARPSPLSQSAFASSPDPMEKRPGGFKGRFMKALDKDSNKRGSKPPVALASPVLVSTPSSQRKPTFASPSETSTRSATPPTTPPQTFPSPSAPFTYHRTAMGSEVSLAPTERTATAPSELNQEKIKRPMFRMKNMSTDNISLASTVSSASMMIRKMGSIGKLARRNSLMGISRIFKDKPKDEDAALPETDGKNKKDKKSKKGKAEPSAATVSHTNAESLDEDRALAGLSPAAKLARQHTLRSKAEEEKRLSGEPASADEAKTHQQDLPSIDTVIGAPVGNAPEVLHVKPRRAPTVVHAVAVSEHEYDSDDDSSEGETVDDVTVTMGKTRLSDDADAEFQATWGNAFIDRYAIPKKGILKTTSSFSEDFTSVSNRQRLSSSNLSGMTTRSYLAQPSIGEDQYDGLHHPRPHTHFPAQDIIYDPFAADFAPFNSPTAIDEHKQSFYQNPAHNTSAPALNLLGQAKPSNPRSMTVPARKKLIWAPECAVYNTYDAGTYDRRSEPATCNHLTPELALAIKKELNAFKMEMPIHPSSRSNTHFFV